MTAMQTYSKDSHVKIALDIHSKSDNDNMFLVAKYQLDFSTRVWVVIMQMILSLRFYQSDVIRKQFLISKAGI